MKFIRILVILFLCTSCAHVITKESRTDLTNVPFSDVLANPEAYTNKNFLLGGIIAETAVSQSGSEIELVEIPIDRAGYLIDRDQSNGRLILKTMEKLDPMIYRQGRDITFVGTLAGSEEKTLGEMQYRYPVFTAKEIFLWREGFSWEYERFPYGYWYPGHYYPYSWHDLYWPRRYYP